MRRGAARWCNLLTVGGLLVAGPGLSGTLDGGTPVRAPSRLRVVGTESAAERQFRQWLERRASEARLEVRKLWRGDLDGDKVPERVALLCSPVPGTGLANWFVIEKSPSERWLLEQHRNSGGDCQRFEQEAEDTPDAGPPAALQWLALGPSLELSDGYATWEATSRVALRDGAPAVVAMSGMSHSMNMAYSYGRDWERLRAQSSREEISEGPGEASHGGGWRALLPVLAREQPLPPTVNRVTFGKQHWSGEADAALEVSVLREGADAVRVRVKVRDDVARPVPKDADAARFLAADHLELWWQVAADAPCDEAKKAECPVRQLGVALREGGGVEARWLHPEKAPDALPAVELREDRVEVVLPLKLLGLRAPSPRPSWPFTVAFSDSDSAEPGQQTLVATSGLRWGVPDTFSELVFTGEGRRYPAPGVGEVTVETHRLKGDALLPDSGASP